MILLESMPKNKFHVLDHDKREKVLSSMRKINVRIHIIFHMHKVSSEHFPSIDTVHSSKWFPS